MVLLCAGGIASGDRGGRRKEKRSGSGGRFGGFGKKKQVTTRDRGSFIDKEAAVDGERSSFTRER